MKITVVIPALNEEKFIGKCLDSVFNQEIQFDEVIVVDSGSTDKTTTIVKKYNVKLVEGVRNLNMNRDIGIRESTSSFVVILDADCTIDLNYTIVLERTLNKNIAMVYGNRFTLERYFLMDIGYAFSNFIGAFNTFFKDYTKLSGRNNFVVNRKNYLQSGGYVEVIPETNRDSRHYFLEKSHLEDLSLIERMSLWGKVIYITDLKTFCSARAFVIKDGKRNFNRLQDQVSESGEIL